MPKFLLRLRRLSVSWFSGLVRWFLLCAIAGVMFFSLKGVGETLSPWSQATISLLTNLYYPESGRDQVTVLLFREQDLSSLAPRDSQTGLPGKLPFPVPYSTHVETLNALGNRSPRAVLIDFSFIDARAGDNVEELLGAICELADQGIPVYLATFYYWQPHHGLRQDLFVDAAGEARRNCFNVVPVAYSPEGNGLVQTYSLQQGGGKNPLLPSAALSLYADGQALDTARFSDGMDLIWGALPPRPQRSDTPCQPVSILQSALRLAKDGPRALERDCPYSNTLSVYSLWNESSDEVDALVRNKYILYGGAFLGTDDWLRSPVHGTIPGVYLHAMALDNLLVFADDYKRVTEHSLSRDRLGVVVADAAIIGFGVAWYMLICHFKRLRGGRSEMRYTQGARWQRRWRFAGLTIPYLFLSIFAGRGLWLAGSQGYAVAQCVLVVVLLVFGGFAIDEERERLPVPLRKIGLMLGEKLVEYGWVALMALLCGVVFHVWNFGPRNFWAFAAFLGFTQVIDRHLLRLASEIKVSRLRKKLRFSWLQTGLLLVGAGVMPYAFGVSSFFVGLLVVLMTAVGLALLVGAALLLPWIYRSEINQARGDRDGEKYHFWGDHGGVGRYGFSNRRRGD